MAVKFNYDEKYDVLHIYDYAGDIEESVQVSEDIILDVDKEGVVKGIEIFYASEFLRTFNKDINKEFLKSLDNASWEYKEFRNQLFIVIMLQSKNKKIYQPMPPLRKSEYKNPLISSM